LDLPYRENIRNPGSLRRFDQGDVLPGLAQHSGVKELQAIEVELDRAPGTINVVVLKKERLACCLRVTASSIYIINRKNYV
jgi:hypothetical protein